MYGDHRDIHEMKNSFPTRSSSDLPRCGEARLFARCRKPGARCARCDQDWTHQQADDFPAYVSIFVTGHLMAPVIIGLTNDEGLSTMGLVSMILPLTLLLTVGLIQPAKGANIELQWWIGMHGFKQTTQGPSVHDKDTLSRHNLA